MKIKTMLLCLLITLALASGATAQEKQAAEDYTKHPGYVDFNIFEIFGDAEPKVEVSLKQPMLNLVSEFTKEDDPELFNMLSKLAVVRVFVFDADEQFTRKFESESSKTIKSLDRKGWEQVVRVREDEDHVFVYLKPSTKYDFIEGIVLLAIEEGDEAVFVNIAGEIRPDDVSALGHHFGIAGLEGFQSHKKDKD